MRIADYKDTESC